MATTRAEVEAVIRRTYVKPFKACRALRSFAEELSTDWHGRSLPERPDGDWIVAGIYPRAVTSFGASIELSRRGYGDQAAMLNRSLFEDMADVGWTILHRREAVGWLEDHHLHRRMLLADAASSEHAYGKDIPVPTFSAADRKRLAAKFGKYGNKPWNGASIHEKATEIESLFQASDLENLRFFRLIVHRENNGLLHMGASALDHIALGRDSEGVRLRVGATNVHIHEALLGAYWPMLQVVRLVVDHFDFPAETKTRVNRARERLQDLGPLTDRGPGDGFGAASA